VRRRSCHPGDHCRGRDELCSGVGPGAGLLPCAAACGLGLAWARVRIAAIAAEQRLPELWQIAIRSWL
jgi:hypothetical protein